MRLQWSFLEHQNRRLRTRHRRSLLAGNRNRRPRRSTLAKTKLRHRLRSSSRLNSEEKAQTSTAAPANTMTKRVNELAACSAMLCSRRDKEIRGKESPDPTHSHRALSPARIPARRRCCCCLPFFPLPLSRLLLQSMLLLFQCRGQGGSKSARPSGPSEQASEHKKEREKERDSRRLTEFGGRARRIGGDRAAVLAAKGPACRRENAVGATTTTTSSSSLLLPDSVRSSGRRRGADRRGGGGWCRLVEASATTRE